MQGCNLKSLLDKMRLSALIPVVLPTFNPFDLKLLLMPSSSRALVDACIVSLTFDTLDELSPLQESTCFNTPEAFVTGASFPSRTSWMDMQRTMFLGVSELTGSTPTAMTQEGNFVNTRKVVAQNSLSVVDLRRAESQKMVFFATANTGSMPHWLRQVRIATHVDESGNMKSISAQSMGSSQVRLTIVTYHSCNRMSCLGCKSTRLQALCYASQQCAVVKCVGTVVNQNRPLCNIGLVMASYAETSLLMMMGAWIIFTETYGKILDAALIGPQNTLQLEWVDDAFFGYVCSAKDTFGQMTSVITSSIGAGIVTGYNNKRRMAAVIDDGGSSFAQDDGFTASVTILLNGVNAFLYQLASFCFSIQYTASFLMCNLAGVCTDFQPWMHGRFSFLFTPSLPCRRPSSAHPTTSSLSLM